VNGVVCGLLLLRILVFGGGSLAHLSLMLLGPLLLVLILGLLLVLLLWLLILVMWAHCGYYDSALAIYGLLLLLLGVHAN
jgi:hypothetical protein